MTKKKKEDTEIKDNVEETVTQEAEQETTEEQETVENQKEGSAETTEEKSEGEDLSDKFQNLQDKHLRLTAEFDNYRKRTLKEKTELIKTGGESVLINMLPIIDDIERAMDSIKNAQDVEAMKEGMDLIFNKFASFIQQNGVTEIEAKEKDFDTDLHEAVAKIPAPSEELKGKIVDVIQKGYMLHDKVVRHSKVVVGE